jgi:DNA topoisomerase-2
LTNIFSSKFILETVDSKKRKKYTQIWRNNMKSKEEPVIVDCDEASYTKITFVPDLKRFKMKNLSDNDIIKLIRRRVVDVAGITGGLKVYWTLDGEGGRITNVKTFKDYISMHLSDETVVPLVYEKVNASWEIAVALSDGHPQQISFVNSISTSKGGTHVNYITNQLTKGLTESINKSHKASNVKQAHVKNHLFVFINSLIVNPSFDSQLKTNLTTKVSEFGSKCEISDKFIKSVLKSGIVEDILKFAEFSNNRELKKSDGKKKTRIRGIPKLEDANYAGGKHSSECTLILTEGDSAKALAIAGFSVVGRDKYGVFPLKGMDLNTHLSINNNSTFSVYL